jgi:anaerobic selenocysteine-containing dehydrogenase
MSLTALPLAPLATRTYCPFCAYQCGTLVDTSAGVRIMGDEHFPVNRGQMCLKGWSAGDLLAHPQRVTQPLRRERITDDWQPCSWDAALDTVAAGIRRTRRPVAGQSPGRVYERNRQRVANDGHRVQLPFGERRDVTVGHQRGLPQSCRLGSTHESRHRVRLLSWATRGLDYARG